MSRRLSRRQLVAGALLLFTVGMSGVATAFEFDRAGGFKFGTSVSDLGSDTGISFFGPQGPPAPADTFQTIGWGNFAGPSFVTPIDPFTQVGSVDDAKSALGFETFGGTINPGDTVIVATYTHANRFIRFPALRAVVINTLLRILDGGTEILSHPDFTAITFTETPNEDTEDACDPATHIAGTLPCSDFFLTSDNALAPVLFTHDSSSYSLTFNLVPRQGVIFEIVDCDGIAGGPTCARVRTAEFSTNIVDVTMTLNLLGTAQLQVAKSDNGIFLPGGQATYTIVVTNLSAAAPAENVELTDQLPGNGGLVWATATPTQGSCTIGAAPDPPNFLRCDLDNIAPGGSVIVTISSTPTTPLAACQSQPNPVARATADGGLEAQDSGSLICAPAAVFVIGDVEPHAIGDVVNFWGAQWWKNNFMSGLVSSGVASFKGFANQNDTFCGGTWSSRPGNSSDPPATIPDFVAVIVTDTVIKDGPDISGNIKEILLVHQDGGYGPNPGHRGNGPVTAVICQSSE